MSFRVLICLAFLLLLAACQNTAETTLSGSIQGTTYHLKMVTRGLPVTAEALKTDVEAIFRLVDEQLSNWREDSAISRFNQQKTTDWQPVPPSIVQLVGVAREIHDRTGGCYDLTVKPLFELWGFTRHEQSVPDDQAIRGVLAHVGMDKLEIDAQGNRLRKKDPEVQVSLDSIAQGYTVAVIAQLLEDRGILNYLAEVGGEMKVRGAKADGTPWRVAVEKPTPMAREVQRILDLQEANGIAVMTSGTYRNFFEAGGKSYSHILDPRTGRPVTHGLLSATVLDESPTLADAWSTALLCVGEVEGARIAEAEGLKALLIHREGDQLKERMSSRFLAEPAPAAPPPQPGPAAPAAPAPAGRASDAFTTTRFAMIDKKILKAVRIEPGHEVRLKDHDTRWPNGGFGGELDTWKARAQELLKDNLDRLAESQELLYADNRYAVLIVFQAMDAAGKDGTIKHVMSGVNPQGCQVFSFKRPSAEELDHTFLWRCMRALPERGRIGIFNRSYYEDVLVTRVHPELLDQQQLPDGKRGKTFWKARYEDINAFEHHLSRNGTVVLKFFLHVSKDEQKRRFLDRLGESDKHWKFSLADLAERALWDDYMDAYEDTIAATSTNWAPWHVIPADHKWACRALVAEIICRSLDELKLAFPEPGPADQAALAEARIRLEQES